MFGHQTMFDDVWSPNISRLDRPLSSLITIFKRYISANFMNLSPTVGISYVTDNFLELIRIIDYKAVSACRVSIYNCYLGSRLCRQIAVDSKK